MKREIKFAAKTWIYYGVMVLVCLVFTVGIGNDIVRLIMNLGLVLGFGYMCFSEGGYAGEKAVAMVENIQRQEKEGRQPPESLREQVFSKKFAVIAFVIALIPFWVVSGLNAAYYPVYSQNAAIVEAAEETGETAEAMSEAETQALPEETEAVNPAAVALEDERPLHWARLTAWAVYVPFSTFNQMCSDGLNVLLFFVYGLILPLLQLIGYFRGPKLHERKIKMMKKGSRRKARGLKVNREPRSQKPVV